MSKATQNCAAPVAIIIRATARQLVVIACHSIFSGPCPFACGQHGEGGVRRRCRPACREQEEQDIYKRHSVSLLARHCHII
jgi:hypothetical protein